MRRRSEAVDERASCSLVGFEQAPDHENGELMPLALEPRRSRGEDVGAIQLSARAIEYVASSICSQGIDFNTHGDKSWMQARDGCDEASVSAAKVQDASRSAAQQLRGGGDERLMCRGHSSRRREAVVSEECDIVHVTTLGEARAPLSDCRREQYRGEDCRDGAGEVRRSEQAAGLGLRRRCLCVGLEPAKGVARIVPSTNCLD